MQEKICYSYFPAAFTPNDDGKNDLFGILTTFDLSDYDLSIYNRWGQKIYETKDYRKGWDGRINGQMQNAGTYIWICNFKKINMQVNTIMKGTVVLLR